MTDRNHLTVLKAFKANTIHDGVYYYALDLPDPNTCEQQYLLYPKSRSALVKIPIKHYDGTVQYYWHPKGYTSKYDKEKELLAPPIIDSKEMEREIRQSDFSSKMWKELAQKSLAYIGLLVFLAYELATVFIPLVLNVGDM